MFLMNAAAYLLLSLPCWKITAGHNTCRTKSAISEHALKGHVISAIEGRTWESCVTLCEQTENCFSINYSSTLKRCELNNKSAEWYGSDLVPASGSLYLTMVSRDYNPCVDRNPPCFGTCVPIPGSSVTRCTCERNVTCHNESACSKPLGMESGSITDGMLIVSSTHPNSNKAWGRLHHSGGSWIPITDHTKQWFQVNFDPEVKRITHIATQGDGSQWYWVEKYYVMFKRQGASSLETYKENNQRVIFTGNVDRKAAVAKQFKNSFEAIAVRIIPTAFSGRIALRIELYGCDIK